MLTLLLATGSHRVVSAAHSMQVLLAVVCHCLLTATSRLRASVVAQQHLHQMRWHTRQCLLHALHAVASLPSMQHAMIADLYGAAMQWCYRKAAWYITVTSHWATLQIQTSIQHAVMMVNPYPRSADSNELLELLALRHNEKSIETLMSSTDMDDLQHIANWETVIQYAARLNASNVHEHVPFLKTPTL